MVGLRRDRRRGAQNELRPPRRAREGDRDRSLHRRPHADGPAPRRVPLRRPPARPHPPHRRRARTGAARCARRRHPRGRPRRPLRRLGAGPSSLRAGHRPLRGRHRRRDRCADTRARTRGGGARRGRPRAATGADRLRVGPRRRRPARASGLGVLRGRRGTRPARQPARLLDGREGRRRRGPRRIRRRRQGAVRDRSHPGRPDRAPRDRRGVARGPRDDLVVDTGSLCRAGRRRPHPRHAGVERPRRRAPPRRGLRRQVRLPLRGATSRRSRAPPDVP